MALLSFNLSEVIRPINGDTGKVRDEIISHLLEQSFNELDDYYETQDWCLHSKVYAFPGPYPKISINLEVSDNYDYNEILVQVSKTFNKNWDMVIQEVLGKMGG